MYCVQSTDCSHLVGNGTEGLAIQQSLDFLLKLTIKIRGNIDGLIIIIIIKPRLTRHMSVTKEDESQASSAMRPPSTNSSAVADEHARRAASIGKILIQSRDHNHAHLGVICRPFGNIRYIAYLCKKFDDSSFSYS